MQTQVFCRLVNGDQLVYLRADISYLVVYSKNCDDVSV